MSYRHPRYHDSGIPLEDMPDAIYDLMMTTAAILGVLVGLPVLLLMIAGAANSAPIVRKGQFCPMQYYRIGEYCAPSTRTAPSAVRIVDETCPIGTYTQSNYCMSLERAK